MPTFDYTGADQTYVVPGNVNRINVQIWGANGDASTAGTTGYGGYVRTRLRVTPGSTIFVYPGEAGNGINGGYGFGKADGGDAGANEFKVFGGGAGSFITLDKTAPIIKALAVAGGGGGAALKRTLVNDVFVEKLYRGGLGGGFHGGNGNPFNSALAGKGASGIEPGEGGSPNGGDGVDGNGGTPDPNFFAGGGGGGLGGGGSGGQIKSLTNAGFDSGSGGGGSGGLPDCCRGDDTLINVQFDDVNYNRNDNPNLFTNGNGFIIIEPFFGFSSTPCCIAPFQVVHQANAQFIQQFRTFNRNQPRLGGPRNSQC